MKREFLIEEYNYKKSINDLTKIKSLEEKILLSYSKRIDDLISTFNIEEYKDDVKQEVYFDIVMLLRKPERIDVDDVDEQIIDTLTKLSSKIKEKEEMEIPLSELKSVYKRKC